MTDVRTQIIEVDRQKQIWNDITPNTGNPLLEAMLDEGLTLEEAGRRYRMLKKQDPIGDLVRKVKQHAFAEGASANLLEGFVATPDAASLLRDGVRFMSLLAYAEQPSTFAGFTTMMPSDRQQEEWLRDAAMGTLPKYKSGDVVPMLRSGLEGGALIKNYQYAGMVEVTGDDIRFDRLGKIRQIAPELGRSARMTEESTVYGDIATPGNYTRNSTTNDNDIGANTQTLTLAPINFETAMTIGATTKDRKSGMYLGINYDTIIIGPRMQWFVRQLLMSPDAVRASANNTAEVRGIGTVNQYLGMIRRIIISPWFSTSYAWALVDSTRQSYMYQTVEPFNVVTESAGPTSEAWLTRDSLRYKVQGYFGTGFVDDRSWFYSDSVTAPTIG